MQTSLLRLPAVLARTGLARSSLYRLIGRGLFPRPVRLAGTRAVAWDSREIDLWIELQLNGAASATSKE